MPKRIANLRWIWGIVFLFVLMPMLSCNTVGELLNPSTPTPTPTVTPTATPTPLPLAERDLSEIALQKSDLPSEFIEFDIPEVSKLLDQMTSDAGDALSEDLVTGYGSFFTSTDSGLYACLVLVYTGTDSAKTAFSAYAETMTAGEEISIPVIGEESVARGAGDSSILSYAVVWRYHEAILELDYAGQEDIGIDELVRLARIIEARLESA